jgi:hypothetical protein
LVAADPALDARSLRILSQSYGVGNWLALAFHSTAHPDSDYWGCKAHTDANNTITGAGGAGNPTLSVKRVDSSNPTGAAWSPNVGDRLETEGLIIASVGEAKIFGSQVATWRDQYYVSAAGVQYDWQLDFNAQAATDGLVLVNTGYTGMLTCSALPGYLAMPNVLAEPIALTLDDNSMTTAVRGDMCRLYGVGLKDVVADYIVHHGPSLAPATLKLQQRTGGDNKIYVSETAGNIAVTDGMVLSGGASLRLYRAPGAPSRRVWP